MENTMIDHKPISEIYEETKREEAEKHRDDWIPSAYNERWKKEAENSASFFRMALIRLQNQTK